MMRTKHIVLALFLLSGILTRAQDSPGDEEIGCPTYFDPADTTHLLHMGNNALLDSVLQFTIPGWGQDSGHGKTSIGFASGNAIFNIPVKIWVYHDDNGSNAALTHQQAEILFESVNQRFANSNTGIRFYMKCSIEHVNSTYLNTINNDSEFNDLMTWHHEPQALNWHLISDAVEFGGKAVFPWKPNNFRFTTAFRWGFTQASIGVTVHEIGHALGLLHTHENNRGSGTWNGSAGNCYQESVSRSKTQGFGCFGTLGKRKCEVNGDALCDTEAAPNRDGGTSAPNDPGWELIDLDNTTNCNYAGTGTDNWGDTWTPPTRNYMSYLEFGVCRNEFTWGQTGVMHSNIILYMATGGFPLPGIGGTPWYNRNALVLWGNVHAGEVDHIVSGETINAPLAGNHYHMEPGSDVTLQAQRSIFLSPGVLAQSGSVFLAFIAPVTDCSSVDQMMAPDGSTFPWHAQILQATDVLAAAVNYSNGDRGKALEVNVSGISTVQIYPNPNQGSFTLELPVAGDYEIRITGMTGNLVYTTRMLHEDSRMIQLGHHLPSGVYHVYIQGDNLSQVEKITVLR
ncbi:MAG: T9SS type A sorting domain-containing protein [Owenweeksia sp.]